jgi:hypothetical protein
MKLDRHVDGEPFHLLRLTVVGAEPAQSSALATTFMKSVRSGMTRLLGLRDSGVYGTEAAVRWYLRLLKRPVVMWS